MLAREVELYAQNTNYTHVYKLNGIYLEIFLNSC